MTDKTYYPDTIDGNPLPISGELITPADTTSKSSTTQDSLENKISNTLPSPRIASVLVSTSLDTQSRKILGNFSFGQVGAIQIGKYVNLVSGDIRITPDGITARNNAGDSTFSLDGDNGNATFKGTVQAGSIIAGDSSIVMESSTGGNGRIVLYNNNVPEIVIGDPS